ncbi:MAG TPA: PRC-barrel domain-containing protein [Candidatus Saccharimonadaceae bacterium]|nr:PRC-barrel domain-containing protein [Candidatus Saccharimonadaceae bacterium]
MLVLGSRFHNTPVMSLQTGARLATTIRSIVDPTNLTVIAFEVEGPLLSEKPAFLRVEEIREVAPIGMIVDSNDEIVGLDDVVKLKKIYGLEFELVGMPVIDEHKRKLGKIEDFTLETGGFVIQQLNVKRGFLKGLNDTGLLIHRTQVVEITDNEVIVKGAGNKRLPDPVTEPVRHDYVNPFRQPSPQPEQADS